MAVSLLIHAVALFGTDVELPADAEPEPLQAEIRMPPPAPRPAPVKDDRTHADPQIRRHRARPSAPPPPPPGEPAQATASEPAPSIGEPAMPPLASTQAAPPPETPAPVEPLLKGSGYIRFKLTRGPQGFEIGRAEQRWEFADGRYRLLSISETSGLAALIKPIRLELESTGTLTADGLRPDHLISRRNGVETNEKADFDWQAHRVTLARDASQYDIRDGAQDIVSFPYQLAYLPNLSGGATMGVAAARKFERYRFDALGEEELETPAGRFRTLHLRVQTDSTTEVWLALERSLLPVKIRHTDKKGDSYEEVATEIGMP